MQDDADALTKIIDWRRVRLLSFVAHRVSLPDSRTKNENLMRRFFLVAGEIDSRIHERVYEAEFYFPATPRAQFFNSRYNTLNKVWQDG